MNIDVTAVTSANPRRTWDKGHMTNRNLLLGRSEPSEKLAREEIAALDQATVPPDRRRSRIR